MFIIVVIINVVVLFSFLELLSDMCINKRWVENRYTHRRILVKCGHCPACLQEKATRMSFRLKQTTAKTVYFLTLTYKNEYLPYIRRSDLDFSSNLGIVPVYRDGEVKKFRSKDRRGTRYIRSSFISTPGRVIDHCRFNIRSDFNLDQFVRGIKSLKHPVRHPVKDAVSVLYYKDFQDFVKRFKINVQRKLNKDCTNETNKFFICSEYGEHTHRGHAHVLLFSENLSLSDVKRTLVASWPYADFSKLRKYCEIAVDASGYVASYVNCADSISSLLAYSPFRPKHSFSQGIGMDDPQFSPGQILEVVRSGSLRYCVKRTRDGVTCIESVPIPQYVLNRYFPYIKGLTCLSTVEINNLFASPKRFAAYCRKYLRYEDGVRIRTLTWLGADFLSTADSSGVSKNLFVNQTRDNLQRFKHCMNRFCDIPGYTPDDYIRDYITYFRTVGREKFKYFYNDIMKKQKVPQLQCYDNIIELLDGSVQNESLFQCIDTDTQIITDPNQFEKNILDDLKNRMWFDSYSKYRHVTNDLMAQVGHDV